MNELLVLIDGHRVGRVSADSNGHPQLVYDAAWRTSHEAYPLSLSLPLAKEHHPAETVAAVMWGLLPDNEQVLQRWASRFHVSPRNPLSLLAHVGEDCAGAVQFLRPERVDEILRDNGHEVDWLDHADVAARLRDVRRDAGQTRRDGDLGQFSLPGAQPKIALQRQGDRWGVPRGRAPTTHILKPPTGAFDGYAENEHFCLNLARRMGLSVCASEIVQFGDETAICVERYDRLRVDGEWRRVHQEDFCQALGVMPQRKYQNEGGPSPAQIAEVLQRYSIQPRVDRENFLLALVFNWLVAGTDAHAKNYSLMISPHGGIRLAPLYDITSAWPYPSLNRRKLKFAMKVGSHYRLHDIRWADWSKLAVELGFKPDFVAHVMRLAASVIADLAATEARAVKANGVRHPVIDRLVTAIADAAVQTLKWFA